MKITKNRLHKPNQILITVEGGLIQNIDSIPEGIVVVVIDYDTEGANRNIIDEVEQYDDTYEEAIVSIWGNGYDWFSDEPCSYNLIEDNK